MLTFEQIQQLVELVARHRLRSLEIDRAGFRVRIEGAGEPAIVAVAPVGAPALQTAAAPTAPPPVAEAPAREELHVVTSPIVGTFYSAPSPEAPAFARVGDRVRRGQVLCIVEAMKLMNEIECDGDGVVVEVYPQNAQPVEFGEALFGIRKD